MIATSCGGERTIALSLTEADSSCTIDLLSELESIEVALSHEGRSDRACLSIATVTTIEELEASLVSSGIAFRELAGGSGTIMIRGFDDPACADLFLCGEAGDRLPRDREIAIPVQCAGCQ